MTERPIQFTLKEWNDLKAENEVLRKAIEGISNYCTRFMKRTGDPYDPQLNDIKNLCKKALEKTAKPEGKEE